MYDNIILNNQDIILPKPFIFSILPINNADVSNNLESTTNLILYDNAGENFQAGRDTVAMPVTRHLKTSDAIFFIYDPIQDYRFVPGLKENGNAMRQYENYHRSEARQEIVLAEMINRTRQLCSMPLRATYQNPLICVVTKHDSWKHLLPNLDYRTIGQDQKGHSFLLVENIKTVSNAVRKILLTYTPGFVSSLEQFASDVTYIPVSATGQAPTEDPETNTLGFQVKNINPYWCDIPVFYSMSRKNRGNIPVYSK